MIAAPQLTLHDPAIRQPIFMRLYRLPSLKESREDGYALSVLEEILDGGAATRFYKSLVVEQKLATGVSFSYDGLSWSDGSGWVSATPADGISMATIETAINAELRAARQELAYLSGGNPVSATTNE